MSETLTTSRPRRWLTIPIGSLTLISIVAVYAISRTHTFQAKHHRYRMKAAWNAMFSVPETYEDGLVGYNVDGNFEKYEYHRDILVELGVIRHVNYRFQHISTPTDESKHLFQRSHDLKPAMVYCESNHPLTPVPLEFTAWVEADHYMELDRFLTESDVPNYREQFMADEEKQTGE